MLQRVAVCCSVLQCVALFIRSPNGHIVAGTCASVVLSQFVIVFCSVLQSVAVCCSVLQCAAACCSVYPLAQRPYCRRYARECCGLIAVCFSVLQRVAVCILTPNGCIGTGTRGSVVVVSSQCFIVFCNVLQRVAVCCSEYPLAQRSYWRRCAQKYVCLFYRSLLQVSFTGLFYRSLSV